MTAHFGEYNLNKPTANIRTVVVERDFIHPSFDESNYDYDFALLRLTGKVSKFFTKFQTWIVDQQSVSVSPMRLGRFAYSLTAMQGLKMTSLRIA